MIRHFRRAAWLVLPVLALPLLIAAAPAPRGLPTSAPVRDWNHTLTITPGGGHLLGNPAARIKLTEYVSYTCPHCAHFETEAELPLRLGFVANGSTSVEVRHLVRDPVDLTVAMLTNCGPKEKFFLNHSALMRGQDAWIAPMINASPARQARWNSGNALTRRRAIAADFGLYAIMARRGYERTTADRCLADEALAKRLADQTAAAAAAGIDSTPSFAIGDVVLAGTHSWDLLQPQLRARL